MRPLPIVGSQADGLLGRDKELDYVARSLAPGDGSRVLLVRGEAGVGKTTILQVAARRACNDGVRLLRIRGTEAETQLAYAGLHQLLHPILGGVDNLPTRQRTALRTTFWMQDGDAPADPMITNLAVLSLLSATADNGPILIVVDDAQWLDRASSDSIAFLARRLEGEPIALLIAARSSLEPSVFERELPILDIAPLSSQDAEHLLDQQPTVLQGSLRRRVLDAAQGNPLALVELAKASAHDDQDEVWTDWERKELPVTERIQRSFAGHLRALPERTRAALLFATAADTADRSVILSTVASTDTEVWAPAEEAGLVLIKHHQIEFRHPLIRSAIYDAATPSERRETHRRLADMLAEYPDRRAWHLAAATTATDATAATALAETAVRAQNRGAMAEAVSAYEQAGLLSPDPHDQAERLARAAVAASIGGYLERAESLATAAAKRPSTVVTYTLIAVISSITVYTRMQVEQALRDLEAAIDTVGLDQGDASLHLLVAAANLAYLSGNREMLDDLATRAATVTDSGAHSQQWFNALNHSIDDNAAWTEWLREIAPTLRDPLEIGSFGTLALILDDTGTAVRLFSRILDPTRDDSDQYYFGMRAASLGWALHAAGDWENCRRVVERLAIRAYEPRPTLGMVRSLVIHAALAVHTGQRDQGRKDIHRIQEVLESNEVSAIAMQADWLSGMAAIVDVDYETAYDAFRAMFDKDGRAVHFFLSYYGLAGLAKAAVRVGRAAEVAGIVQGAERLLLGRASRRLQFSVRWARAWLMSDERTSRSPFTDFVGDPDADQWPFEHAMAMLDHGEWLRRNRQIALARKALAAAEDRFRRLGAVPWVERAQAELRAAGVSVAPPGRSALDNLSPQQQQIVRLAAEGLTNREIGERLFLSHRTVGFHLHNAFPKLGVSSRAQLGKIL